MLKISRQRITASRALKILQNLSSDCFDKDSSDSENNPVVNAALANVPAVESDESDSDDEADDNEFCRARWTRSDLR